MWEYMTRITFQDVSGKMWVCHPLNTENRELNNLFVQEKTRLFYRWYL